MNKILLQLQKKLPQKCGVYLFINSKEQAIYIGKAKNLKKRTTYYFKEKNLPKRFEKMISEAVNLQYFITESETDAFLLEAKLIEEKQPIYNILYRNGRPLYYIYFTKHNFPKVEIGNEWQENAVGPFLSIEYIKNILNHVLKIFQLRTCSDFVFKHRKRPCLEYFAKRCSAPCVNLITQTEYEKNTKMMKNFFHGKVNKILIETKKTLKTAIKEENFLLAAKKRDEIINIEKLKQKQTIYFENIKKLDVVCSHKNYFYIESIRNCAPANIEHRKYEKKLSLEQFLIEYYIQEPEYRVIGPVANISFKKYSTKFSKLEKQIFQEANKRMLSLINEDENKKNYSKILNIELNTIEIYDSSHYSGKNALCAMVHYDCASNQFIKNNYRVWKMTKNTKNDLEILENGLTKRKYKENLPNMILLDGGKTQLNIARKIFDNKILFAFAKGEKRKKGTLYGPNGKIRLNNELMLFLEKLRDEAHRWAKKNSNIRFSKNFTN